MLSRNNKLHFTGIGDAVMFDLAIALKKAGHVVTGSDAAALESTVMERLKEHGLLPDGDWHPERLTSSLDGVVLGPAIPKDNSELRRAMELKLPILSYPELVHQLCRNKHRIIVAGSHGKTMITLLILHVLSYHHRTFDYVLCRPVPGVAESVKLTDAPLVIIDAEDDLASCLDPTPIFLKYHHHIGIISGIEWFSSHSISSKEEYARQFSLFEKATPKGGILIYFDLEPVVAALAKEHLPDVLYIPYKTHPSQVEAGQEFLVESSTERHPVKLSGKHNLQNISAAKETVKKLGITTPMFYEAIRHFGVIA